MAEGSGQAPAGWYDDPHQPGRMRYFDGEIWTDHFHEPGKLPDIGTWFSTTFSALFAYWPGAMALAFGAAFLGNLLSWLAFRNVFAGVTIVDDELLNFDSGSVPILIGAVLLSLIVQALVYLALSRYMQRAHFQANPTIADAISHGLQRLPRLLGASLLIFVACFGIAFVVVLLGAIAPALAVIAILGLIVLAIWAMVKLVFLASAAVAAPKSQSIIRTSAAVSEGRFWPVLGRVLMFVLVLPIAANLLTAVFGPYGSVVNAQAVSDMLNTSGGSRVFNDFALSELFPTSGRFVIAAAISSLIAAIVTLISTSAAMRLYLDSGAPSEISADPATHG